jgi:hypothetical protein
MAGASFPLLYERDFLDLGVELDHYAAQSLQAISTANGLIYSRVYEMFVAVVQEETCAQLVDENDAVWPAHPKYLGGLCPVAQLQSAADSLDPQGLVYNARLSGLLPFLACYVSCTPARNRMFLGEDRNGKTLGPARACLG